MNYKLVAYAQDFVSFLIEKLNEDSDKIKQIILFGSAARGESGKKSDVDLFIDVLDEKLENKIKKLKQQFQLSDRIVKYWDFMGIKNEINCSIGKLEEWDDLKRSLIANGILLYGKYKGTTKTTHYSLFLVTPGKNRNKNISMWRKLYGYKQKVGKKTYIKKGLIRDYEGRKLAKGVFTIPQEHTEKIISFFKKNKFVKYELIPFWQEKS